MSPYPVDSFFSARLGDEWRQFESPAAARYLTMPTVLPRPSLPIELSLIVFQRAASTSLSGIGIWAVTNGTDGRVGFS